jgi:hypothetical protein
MAGPLRSAFLTLLCFAAMWLVAGCSGALAMFLRELAGL